MQLEELQALKEPCNIQFLFQMQLTVYVVVHYLNYQHVKNIHVNVMLS